MDKRNSIMTHVSCENPAVCIMGCPCLIVHNTAVKAADVFESVSVNSCMRFLYNRLYSM